MKFLWMTFPEIGLIRHREPEISGKYLDGFSRICQWGLNRGFERRSKHQIVNLLKMHWITWSSRFSWLYKSGIMSGQNHQRKNSSRQKCWNSCCQGKTRKLISRKFESSSKVDLSKIQIFGQIRYFESLDLWAMSDYQKFKCSREVPLENSDLRK